MKKEYIEIKGAVDTVIYQNEENGYTVLKLKTSEGGTATAVGCLPFVVSGEQLVLRGSWVTHPAHGTQFKVEQSERMMPVSAKEIYAYLSSGVIKGVGPSTARQIVERFGEDTLRIIEEEPEELTVIKGISKKRAIEISQSYIRQTSLRRLMEFFTENELSLRYAMRVYKVYGDHAQAALIDNPYLIVDEYFGADFSEADRLAMKIGFRPDSRERIEAALLYVLAHNAENGHSFIPVEKLVEAVSRLIGVEEDICGRGVRSLTEYGSIVYEEIAGRNACYLKKLHSAETYIARRLLKLSTAVKFSSFEPDKLIDRSERELGIILAEGQREAVRTAAVCGVMALTGGPGTGKTTTVKAILSLYDKMGLKTALAAPTGRAAKRMSELCGREASTIHRLLEVGYDPNTGELIFSRDENDPLDADAVILDESSMVDIILMQALLSAMKPNCRLVMVGDADQLPSVGPGNLFGDVIKSGAVRTVRLTEIFRQAEESLIVKNAHLINKGITPDLTERKGDFFFLARSDGERAVETIEELCSTRLPKNMGIDASQIQVLSPTRHYITGTNSLNKRLQQVLNPPSAEKGEKVYGEFTFRLGDRVMQIKNNYDIIWKKDSGEIGTGIFNGDVGQITELDTKEQILTIEFDDKRAVYTFDMLSEIEPAYAITVHKSQGSEYRAVILSLMKGAPTLLSRAVLYTAVTRARELLIIVGDGDMLRHMVENDKPQRRYSGLKARLERGY